MKTIREIKRLFGGVLGLVLVAGATACSNPVGEEHEDHPIGLALLSGTTTVATWTLASGPVGTVSVAAGSSATFRVVVIGEDGNLLDVDGTEFAVGVAGTGQGITAEVRNADQVVITGGAAGSSTLDLVLRHDGHDELTAEFAVEVQ